MIPILFVCISDLDEQNRISALYRAKSNRARYQGQLFSELGILTSQAEETAKQVIDRGDYIESMMKEMRERDAGIRALYREVEKLEDQYHTQLRKCRRERHSTIKALDIPISAHPFDENEDEDDMESSSVAGNDAEAEVSGGVNVLADEASIREQDESSKRRRLSDQGSL
ncbi:hypothetical protein K474DRAFT_1714361 [Panus rudis PR-1116 ss-1]|nr:hypothetical protein K474DRAFT_1714361 [Panus rudis PR-1116 ss-1]